MLRIGIAITAIALVLAGAVRLDDSRHGLQAQYFTNTRWVPPAARSVRSLRLSTAGVAADWGGTAPDAFSATWTGWLTVLRTGTYSFTIASDGPAALFIDHARVPSGEPLTLSSGTHHLFLQYAHDRGAPQFDVQWAREQGPRAHIPSFSLTFRRPANYAVAAGEALLPDALAIAQWTWSALLLTVCGTAAWRGSVRLRDRLAREDYWPALRSILVASLVLDLLGIWWGLPVIWVPNELRPIDAITAISHHFAQGWHDMYPPLQYYVLSAVLSPILLLRWWGRIEFGSVNTLAVMLIRLVSIFAALGVVTATCAAGRLAFGRRAGLFAAAMMALNAPFLFYAKTGNVDVPYLFWCSLSFVWYLLVLQRGTRRDYVLFAVFTTLAVCTKDQAYGLYLLMPVVIVTENWRAERMAGRRRGALVRALTDRRLWTAAAVSALLFALVHNLAFNSQGFAAHVRYIVGDGSVPYRVFEPTLAGRWRLLRLTLDLTQQSFGWPFTVALGAGFLLAMIRPGPRRVAVWLIVPIASYYLSFINVIVYNYDRFMLPVSVILALFGGLALDRLTCAGRAHRWRIAIASAAFAYTLLYAGTVDFLMIRDSRYRVERWLQANVRPGQVVGSSGIPDYIPRLDAFNHSDVASLEALDRIHPEYVVINADYVRAVPPETDWGQLVAALQHGTAGYTLVERFRTPLPWSWLPGGHHDLVGPRQEVDVFSTLRNINPTIEVFQRRK